jgi:alkanesulfonate monooxygenase SsuD/methylene tetrahydromethanopterin reductase-like flavin-dependent oxidoreductase (luciferase family)
MDFGISFPTYIRAFHDARMAEDYGFSHAWFYDSQMCYSDVYATMALCAQHTRTIKLGTYVSILGNRIAPVTAHSIATINELAPGRTILGVGTGWGARNVMGMPPTSLKTMREDVTVIRDLLAGKEALYREGSRERQIKFLHPNEGFINLDDNIPIHMASNGPKAMKLTGQVADGWITIGLDPKYAATGVETVRKAALDAGRDSSQIYCSNLTTGCVLRPGESVTSPRVLRQVGPFAILLLHAVWDPDKMVAGPFAPPNLAPLAQRYFHEHVLTMDTPLERRYQEMHLGHLIFVRPEEKEYLTPELIRTATLTGPAGEIVDRIHELEEAGVDHIALNVCGTDARELIREFGNEVIAKL